MAEERLKDGPWSDSIVESKEFDLLVNFDDNEIPDELLGNGLVLSPNYRVNGWRCRRTLY